MELHDLDAVVEDFIQRYRPARQPEFRFYRDQSDLAAAIDVAALAKRCPDGKRHGHQTRLPRASLERLRDALLDADVLGCTSFEHLHDLVARIADPIPKIGPLARYDCSLRLAFFLRLEPERVYLHQGTLAGARSLGIKRRDIVEMSELPAAFSRLLPREVEDCLCVYKDEIARIMASSVSSDVTASSDHPAR